MASENLSKNRRVLAIQSHVVHGYVGNKSATFPLQLLGFDVDAINSVHFSNHTGYKHVKGQVLSNKELRDVFDGLNENGLLDGYSHLLTGYIGNDSFLHQISETVKAMRAANSNLIYVCDPVLGDNGKLYVPQSLIPIYREEIIPLSDICTPNQFEAELLSETKIKTEVDAWNALNWFHEKGVKTVVLSSTNISDEKHLKGFLSHKNGNDIVKYTIQIPIIGDGIIFTGVGDLFAAIFLANSTLKPTLKEALEQTIATLQAVLKNTVNAIPIEYRSSQKLTARQRELRLIQSKTDIECPNVIIHCDELHGE